MSSSARTIPVVVSVVVAVFGVSVCARGSVLSTQLVPNPGNANLNSVVQFDTATQMVGTGAIICDYVGANGDGFFVVLTADHVVSPPAPIADRIGFLNSPVLGGPAGAPNNNLLITQIFHGGATGKEDLAVVAVDYGKAPDNFFNSITPLGYTSLADPNGTQFTEVGFGNTGTENRNGMGQLTGYTMTANSSGIKRFQNNVVTGTTANFPGAGGYVYTSVDWTLDNPGVGGEGYTFAGDSGAPYFTDDPITLGGVKNVFTDQIFAVHTSGINGVVNFGDAAHGDLLTNKDLEWISNDLGQLDACPEPATMILMLIGAGALGGASRVRRHTVL